MRLLPRLVLSVCITSFWGCAGPKPIEDYVLAQAAIEAARESGAPSLAAGFMTRAEEVYSRAVKQYNENDNEVARDSFRAARGFAEKAENAAKIKKFQSGDGAP